jgi:hypothetical protein
VGKESQDIKSIMDRLERVCTEVIAANAVEIDREGRFPTENIAALSEAGLTVSSMRNKTNRLEELFMRLVDRRDKEHTKLVAEPEVQV